MKNCFTMLDDTGEEIVYDLLFTFENEETGKNYIVYTDNSYDEEGNVQVFASIYSPDNPNGGFEAIESEREWRVIEVILESLTEQANLAKNKEEFEQLVKNEEIFPFD